MPEQPPKKKDFWDIIQALGPAIIAATVGLVGGMYNHQQAQLTKASEMREVYTKIMTERESSDNAIRAKMFEMLFNAMFAKGAGAAAGDTDDFGLLKQRVMFLDVLSRNFDTVDIRPLFEDLDSELTKLIYSDNLHTPRERGQYFGMRSELRRIGKNLSLKQLNALASLPGTIVRRIIILQDKDGGLQAMSDDAGGNTAEDPIPIEVKAEGIQDGMVEVSLEYKKAKASDQGFKAPAFMITFYDLPYIDNSVIDKDMRVGVVLTKHVSTSDLERFRDQLDRKEIKDYEDLRDGGITQYAELRIIKFPAKYTGHRDRPYLSEILEDLVEGSGANNLKASPAR
ncbi:MAG TPA: hypothetical protein PLB81_04210 [Deltaproteobacteria bacterium]|nr:hypothetical protein [Deltaproteobacteria bacterium]